MSSPPPPLPNAAEAAETEVVPTEEHPLSTTEEKLLEKIMQLTSGMVDPTEHPSFTGEKPLYASLEKIKQLITLGHLSPTDTSGVVDPTRKSKILEDVNASVARLKSSDFYSRFLTLIDTDYFLSSNLRKSLPNNVHFQLVAYGVGSIEESSISRLQLSLAILLSDKLPSTPLRPQIMDPIFNATECAALEDLGFSVLPFKEIDSCVMQNIPTLFYMPSCDFDIMNNLLRANWHPEHLQKMIILGEAKLRILHGLKEKVFERVEMKMEDLYPYVLAAENFCYTIEVEPDMEKDDVEIIRAFFMYHWHFFRKHELEMWEDWCDPPVADPQPPVHLPFRREKTRKSDESSASTK